MPVQVIQTTAASGAVTLPWVPLNIHDENPRVQWSLNKTGNGTFTANIDYTLDDMLDADVSALAIADTAETFAAATAREMSHPASGIRLVISAASGNNQIAFRVLQTGT